jgi:hypothetical protein
LFNALGCASGKTHDIGDEDVGAVNLELVDYAADWDGYAEAKTFNDTQSEPNTDRIRLSIHADGTGSLRVGNAELQPPPMPGDEPALDGVRSEQLLAGIEYPISEVRVEDRRLRFQLNAMQPWSTWCAAQPPLETGDPEIPYSCVKYSPNQWQTDQVTTLTDGSAGGAPGNPGVITSCTVRSRADESIVEPAPCGALTLCGAFGCECSAAGCEYTYPHSPPVTVDAHLNTNSELEGTLVIGVSPIEHITIRMTK